MTSLEYRLSKELFEGDFGKLGQSVGVVKVDETSGSHFGTVWRLSAITLAT
jgi:hypothetical protein